MVTHVYKSFLMPEPTVAPDGSVIVQYYETDDDGHPTGVEHIFPMSADAATQYRDKLSKALGQKVDVANMQDMRRATSGVSTSQSRR